MKKISMLLGMLFLVYTSYSQQRILIQFATQVNFPIVSYSDATKSYSVTTNDTVLNGIFKLFTITKFQKEYPHAYLVKHKNATVLDKVYLIEVTENINGLYQKLKNINSSLLEGSINLLDAPQILALPNDYNLVCFPFYCHTYCYGLQNDLINAPAAWNITTGNPNVRIAITDVNFRRTQEELNGKVVLDNANTFNSLATDHGTGVAVMAAGNTNNGVGLSSIGYNCKVDLYDYANYDIMLLAAMNGARVINCSWYSQCYPVNTQQLMIDMIHDTYNTVIVAAAGNGLRSCGYQADHYPASYKHVISITGVRHAVNVNEINSCFAYSFKDVFYTRLDDTTVVHFTSNTNVDLSAPACGVIIARNNDDQTYTFGYGTSYASPAVAGTAALILSINPNLTADDVESILKCTARDIYEIPLNIRHLNALGSGRLDAGKAVQLAQTWVPGSAITQQAPPTDIRWFEILSNGINTIELESTCAANSNSGYCNIGYRLEVVAPNPNQTFKWLTFYSENIAGISPNVLINNIRYGNSIYLSRGVDYPFINNNIGNLKACVRVNECIPSVYYAEDRASNCLGNGCTYNCPADITITGNYTTPLKESYTWVKSIGQTNISPTTSVKLDGSPTQGYVEFKPLTGSDYLLAAPTSTGEFIVQAYNGCDAGAPSRTPINNINQIAIEGQIASDKMAVYPNPTNGLFYVECKNNISNIQVYNTQGLHILEKKIANIKKGSQIVTIDLSKYSSDIYILKSNEGNFIYKIIKL